MAELSTARVARAVWFGPFRLIPTQRLLLEGNKPLHVGSRALEILIILVERAGELVSKDELTARVWPNMTLEESNLKVHVAALRRVLADGQAGNRYIITIPGRGYRFVAPISPIEEVETLPPKAVKHSHNLPVMLTRVIGRADTVSKLAEQLAQRRFLTIVGTGGVGTTTVALALAEAVLPAYEDGVRFVELAPLADPRLVPAALAGALGLEFRADDLLAGVIAALRDKQMLVVLDNCERLVTSAAALAVAVLKEAPRVHIGATSREPLRAEGEHVHRLQPLAFPPSATDLTAAEALTFPAVQLFVERAAASLGAFELTDAEASFAATICAKLDGVPLAIEFAAARVDAFGVRGLAARLDDRLQLLTSGRRTGLARHRTMRATLDWSYEILPEAERLLLRRSAVFAGAFSLESASAVLADSKLAVAEIAERIANLVAKSLITADVGGPIVLYRLLETTRAYAREKLDESGEPRTFAQRHAEYYRDLYERVTAKWGTRPAADFLAEHRCHLDEVRAALDWAFSPGGEASVGVALTIAVVPLWFELSLMAEARGRVERALSIIEPGSIENAQREMQLLAALGASLLYTPGVSRIATIGTKALELADTLDQPEYQLRALWGLWAYRITVGEYRAALTLAQRFRSVAERDADTPDLAAIGDRMVGLVLHFLGEQSEAKRHIESMLEHYVVAVPHSHTIRFPIDQRVAARVTLARILWLQGFPEQALRTAHSTVEEALALDHPMSRCYATAVAACPVELFVGDLPAAERSVATLLDDTARHGLALLHIWGRGLKGAVVIRRGDAAAGTQLLERALNDLRETRSALLRMEFVAALAQGLGRVGQVVKALRAVDKVLEEAERTESRWCIAELLRIKGELLLLEGGRDASAAAERLFEESLFWARRQEALSWELRASISLARLRHGQRRTEEAYGLLAAVCGRFTEGFETTDFLTAKKLLLRSRNRILPTA